MGLSPVSRAQPSVEATRVTSPRDLARLYFDYALPINMIVGGLVAAALLVAFITPPSYQLNSQLIVLNKRIGAPDGAGNIAPEADRYAPPSLQDIETETRILKSNRVLRNAATALIGEGILPGPDGGKWSSLSDREQAAALEETVEFLADGVDAQISPGSTIIDLGFIWEDADAGAQILNQVVETYLAERLELTRAAGVVPMLEKNRDFYRNKILELQDQRAKLLATKGIARVDGRRELNAASLLNEQQNIRDLETRIAQLELWINQLGKVVQSWKTAGPGKSVFSPLPLQDPALQEAEQSVNEALATYQRMIATYNSSSRPARSAYQTYAGLRRNYISLVESRIPQLRIERNSLAEELQQRRNHLAGLEGQTSDVESVVAQVQTIDIELLAAEEAYKSFSARRDAALANEVVARLNLSNVQVLQAAIAPLTPAYPDKKVMAALGLFAGLLLAGLYVAFDRFLRVVIRTPDDVIDGLDMPVLGYTAD